MSTESVAQRPQSAAWAVVRRRLRVVRKSRQLQVGLIIVGGVALLGLLAPIIAPYGPKQATSEVLAPPSAAHWFGTDKLGFDVLSRTLYAPRTDILIAVATTLIAIAVGAPLGVAAGFRGGIASEIASRSFDVIQAFPFFVLAIFLLGIFGPSTTNVIGALAVVNTPIYFRLMRGEAARLKERDFIAAARVAGCKDADLMFRHILPNSLVPLLAQMSVTVAWTVLLTAGVSFIGAGVRPPTPEWGLMISSGSEEMISGHWWTSFFPGVTLAITVIGYALLANGINDLADPRKRLA